MTPRRQLSSLFLAVLSSWLWSTPEAFLPHAFPEHSHITMRKTSSRSSMGSESSEREMARRIMYHQHRKNRESVKYQIIAVAECEALARRIEDVSACFIAFHYFEGTKVLAQLIICPFFCHFFPQKYPDRFSFHPTKWNKFPDGTDNIEIGGFTPHNLISGEHVLFLASFHNNDVTLSQFQVMICLLMSFIESLTVVLPYSPVGTY